MTTARKTPDRLPDITQRWKAAQLVERWRGLPPGERQEVLADLEETARSLHASHPVLAANVVAALDVLDAVSADGALGLWTEATADVHWLIEEVQRLRE